MAEGGFDSLQDWSLDEENNDYDDKMQQHDTSSPSTRRYERGGDREQMPNLSGMVFGGESNFTEQILELSDEDDEHKAFQEDEEQVFGAMADDEELSSNDFCHDLERNPFDGLSYSSQYYDLLEKRKQLLIWRAKDDFVQAVDESPIVLVTGKTNSGKSTQIPQWCAHFAKEMDFASGTVLCVQPTSLAAISLANQVTREMDFTSIGNEVGYEVPFAECCNDDTMLKFSTDREILREMTQDPSLERYGVIILDEIQQRTVASDILLALLRYGIPAIYLIIYNHRDNLRLILISLPHEMPKLEEFFDGVPVVDLTFLDEKEPTSISNDEIVNKNNADEVNKAIIYAMDSNKGANYTEDAVNIAIRCHCDQQLNGDILIFMPSKDEINNVCEKIAREVAMKSLRSEAGEAELITLHTRLPIEMPRNLYDSETTNTSGLLRRKIIVADQLAESSFSVGNIIAVIDSGRILVNSYNCRIRARSYALKFISKTSANLRAERCAVGGKVYRLYTPDIYQHMVDQFPPEINSNELTGNVLLMKRLLQQLGATFNDCQLLDPPAPDAYMQALEDLDYHGALDDNGQLSDLGAVMTELPLSLRLAKTVIASCGECCTEEITTLVSMIAAPYCIALTTDVKSKRNSSTIHKFADGKGDHFMLINIFNNYISHRESEKWCKENNLNFYSLKVAKRIRDEVNDVMEKLELPKSARIRDKNLMEKSVTRALLAGFFMQVSKDTDGSGNYLIIRDKHVARLNPGTCIEGYPEWILYNEFVLSDNSYLHTVTAITEDMVAEIAPLSYLSNLPDSEIKDGLIRKATDIQARLKQEENDNESNSCVKPATDKVQLPGKVESIHKNTLLPLDARHLSQVHSTHHHNTLLDHVNDLAASSSHKSSDGKHPQTFRDFHRQKTTFQSPQNKKLTGGHPSNVNCVSTEDNGDIDIISQTARELKQAYDQAATYYNTATTDEGCAIQ